MKGKLLFGAGIAAGYVLGSRSGRAAYEKLKARAAALWESQPVQDKVAAATEAVKEKAPEVSEQLGEAARRAGTVIGSAVHRDASPAGNANDGERHGSRRRHPRAQHPSGDRQPRDSVHRVRRRVGPGTERPAGQDWSDEGGATRAGAATNVDPDKRPSSHRGPPSPGPLRHRCSDDHRGVQLPGAGHPGRQPAADEKIRRSAAPAAGSSRSAGGRPGPAIAAPRPPPAVAPEARLHRRRGKPAARGGGLPAAWCRFRRREHTGR